MIGTSEMTPAADHTAVGVAARSGFDGRHRLRLDPRAKLFLLLEANLLLFCHVNTRTEALLTALFLLPLFLSGRIRSGVRFTLIYGALLVVLGILMATGTMGRLLAVLS